MAERKSDEYKNVKFYAENTKAKQAGFSKFVDGKDFYFCRYIDGKIAMLSQAYTSAAGRDNGIASVKKNEKLVKRYVFEARGPKSHGFALKAGNGQEIAISPNYSSAAEAEKISGRLTGKVKAKSGSTEKAKSKSAPKKTAAKTAATAAAVAFTASDKRIENYKPLAFYEKHGGKADGFNSFEENGAYYFHYNENGEIVLISESYTSKTGRDNGIASVEKNMKLKSAYQYHQHKNGKHYFDLNAANHQEIATSRWYGSAAAAAAGAAYLLGTRKRATSNTAKAASGLAAGAAAASAASAKANPAKPSADTKPAATKPAPVKAAPIAAAAVGTAAIAGAAAMSAAPTSKPVAAEAPVAAAPATGTLAAADGGGGIWGWLKWVLMGLIALLAVFFLVKSCVGEDQSIATAPAADVTDTSASAAPAAMVTCWNGMEAKTEQACPVKVTCWDESFATNLSECPAKPAVAAKPVVPAKTTAGTTIAATSPDVSVGNMTSAKMSAPSVLNRICAPSSNPLFNVSEQTPKNVGRLGTNPQFGNSLAYTPEEFYRRLQVKYRTSPRDKSFLDLLAKSLGHGTFANMDASMFSNDTLANGTSGLIGFGSFHALQYSKLNVSDPTHLEAFKVKSANGTDVHFMKRCGNYVYVCQP